MKHFLSVTFLAALAIPALFAQKWEVGVGGGGSFYTSQTFKNAVGNADAGLSNGGAVSAWLGNNSGRLFGGELRYDYENTNLKISSGSTKVTFGAMTNAVHYDFLLHFTPRGSAIRPFVAAGAGVKVFSGTDSEKTFQPLSNIGILTHTNELEALVSVGAGIKFVVTPAFQLRVEVHDFMSPFPKSVVAPTPNTSAGGWLQDFVVMAGLSFTF